MDELLSVAEQIRDLLQSINEKLEEIEYNTNKLGDIEYNTNNIEVISDKVRDIAGCGVNSIDDICNKLDSIDTTVTCL